LLLYSPACRKSDFIHAIGYLIRRLDENTGPDNFLSHAFNVHVDSDDWRRLEQQFLDCFDAIDTLSAAPRRTQDRREPIGPLSTSELGSELGSELDEAPWQQFENEPDTDFSLPQNTVWAERLVESWQSKCDENAIDIPLFVAGEDVSTAREMRECLDPSRPGCVVGRYRQAVSEDVPKIVRCAVDDPDGWRTRSHRQRAQVLRKAAHEIRAARGDLMGAALADGGKTLLESDPEVSESVVFVVF
jgi:RHH-type proline utilization regulon transcriptional repressor/proline dehydrogenase/delta 1-pyrroline-5-carboxylate dehydrogenase